MFSDNEKQNVASSTNSVSSGRVRFLDESDVVTTPQTVPGFVGDSSELRSEELKKACDAIESDNASENTSSNLEVAHDSSVKPENKVAEEENINYAKQVLADNAVLLKQHTKVTASAVKKNVRKHKGLFILLLLIVGFIVLVRVAMNSGKKDTGEYDEFKLTQMTSDQTNKNKDLLQQSKDGIVVKKESQSNLTFTDITGKENQERIRKEKEKELQNQKNTTSSNQNNSNSSPNTTSSQSNKNSSSYQKNNYNSNQPPQQETQQKNTSSWSWDDVASTDGTSVKQNSSSSSSDGSSVTIPPGFLIYCDIRSATEIDENNILVTGISCESHPQYNIQKGTIFYGQVYDLKVGANKAYVRFNRMVTNGKVYGITAAIMDVNKTDGITVIVNKHTLSNAGKKIVNTTIDVTSTVVTPGPLSDTGNTVSSSLKSELRGATASIPGGKKFYVRF